MKLIFFFEFLVEMSFKEQLIYSLSWIAPNEREPDNYFMFYKIISDCSDFYP